MISAVQSGPVSIVAQYDDDVTAGDFTAADFQTLPGGLVCISVAQLGSTNLDLGFAVSVSGQDDLHYDGSTPGITSPQTIALS